MTSSMNACTPLTFSTLYSLRILPREWHYPQWADLPNPINIGKIISHGHARGHFVGAPRFCQADSEHRLSQLFMNCVCSMRTLTATVVYKLCGHKELCRLEYPVDSEVQ